MIVPRPPAGPKMLREASNIVEMNPIFHGGNTVHWMRLVAHSTDSSQELVR